MFLLADLRELYRAAPLATYAIVKRSEPYYFRQYSSTIVNHFTNLKKKINDKWKL